MDLVTPREICAAIVRPTPSEIGRNSPHRGARWSNLQLFSVEQIDAVKSNPCDCLQEVEGGCDFAYEQLIRTGSSALFSVSASANTDIESQTLIKATALIVQFPSQTSRQFELAVCGRANSVRMR